ncbi:preprotein translocase subunit SecE [Candidatus Peregrinibacteria bacterium]|nr:preprotein translocase subunit SecE [Candidatus Peregrinibacteria bacterium]
MSQNKIVQYFTDSYQELRRVTWPTKNQAVRLTAIVLGFCLFMAAVIGLLDFLFNSGYKYLIMIS